MELMSNAYRYVFKNMMTADQFVLFERAIAVIDSCKTHYQLVTAIRYSGLLVIRLAFLGVLIVL